MSHPNLPPLSTTTKFLTRSPKTRQQHSPSSPEWYWKLSTILPFLWIRDANSITPSVVQELESAWLYYQTLSIPGLGEGGGWACRTRKGRRALEVRYMELDVRTRRALEVALARCEGGFVIRCADGSLDYCTDGVKDREVDGQEDGNGKGSRGCVMM